MLSQDDRRRVDEVWGHFAEQRDRTDCYLDIEYVQQVYQQRRYPQGQGFLDSIARATGGPFRTTLVLGCGDGRSERSAFEKGLLQRVVGVDLSQRALKQAEALARQAGIPHAEYREADLNDLPEDLGSFHLILAPASLHHVQELEGALDWITRHLDEDGVFALGEYVGPSRFQWTDKQLEMTRDVLGLIPEHFKLFANGEVKTAPWQPTEQEIIAADPTEAVRAGEILGLVEQRFDVVERVDLGGGLLFPLLQGIAHHYHHKDATALSLLRFLLYLDDLALREAVLPNTSSDVIGRPRKSS
jgi:SAM-dependent methyltransferase